MKIGEPTICYLHDSAQKLLENLLILKGHSMLDCHKKDIKEAIDLIGEANDAAQRMENKLHYYKELMKNEKITN